MVLLMITQLLLDLLFKIMEDQYFGWVVKSSLIALFLTLSCLVHCWVCFTVKCSWATLAAGRFSSCSLLDFLSFSCLAVPFSYFSRYIFYIGKGLLLNFRFLEGNQPADWAASYALTRNFLLTDQD